MKDNAIYLIGYRLPTGGDMWGIDCGDPHTIEGPFSKGSFGRTVFFIKEIPADVAEKGIEESKKWAGLA